LNPMKIYKFSLGNFAVNNYLVHAENSKQAILFDAGESPAPILAKIAELDLNLEYLWAWRSYCR
jgi:glyoxylase-like metal-dependent hydrolase (beta-lactamase superfamily II)